MLHSRAKFGIADPLRSFQFTGPRVAELLDGKNDRNGKHVVFSIVAPIGVCGVRRPAVDKRSAALARGQRVSALACDLSRALFYSGASSGVIRRIFGVGLTSALNFPRLNRNDSLNYDVHALWAGVQSFPATLKEKRHRGDSNPCGQSPIDFESISLTARTQCQHKS